MFAAVVFSAAEVDKVALIRSKDSFYMIVMYLLRIGSLESGVEINRCTFCRYFMSFFSLFVHQEILRQLRAS